MAMAFVVVSRLRCGWLITIESTVAKINPRAQCMVRHIILGSMVVQVERADLGS